MGKVTDVDTQHKKAPRKQGLRLSGRYNVLLIQGLPWLWSRPMAWIDVLGYAAATLTSLAWVPQAWRAWKTRSVRDLSLWMYLLVVTGILLWLIYGALIQSWPLVLANTLSLTFTTFILLTRLLWR